MTLPEILALPTNQRGAQLQVREQEALSLISDDANITPENVAKSEAIEAENVQIRASIDNDQAAITRAATLRTQIAKNVDSRSQPANLLPTANPNGDRTESKIRIPSGQRLYSKLRNINAGQEPLAYAMGMFWRALSAKESVGRDQARAWCTEHGMEYRALSEGNNNYGGALVPDILLPLFIDNKEEYGVYRKEAFIVPMTSDTVTFPRRKSGTAAQWVSENGTPTKSNVTFDQVKLVAKDLQDEVAISNNLGDDAILNLGDIVTGELRYGFDVALDTAAFIGDGSPTYGGIFGFTEKLKSISSAKGLIAASGNAFDEITRANLHSVKARLPNYARQGAKWYMNNELWAGYIEPIFLALGGATAESLMNGITPKMLGHEVVLVEALPDTAVNSGVPLLFGNIPKTSTMGDRRQLMIKTSDIAGDAWDLNQTRIKAMQRVDINHHNLGTTTVAGSMIGLQLAAS